MVKVKKRDGRLEEFNESKIVEGIKKAGASIEEAMGTAKKITERMAQNTEDLLKMGEINADLLSRMVVAELEEINKSVAEKFVKFRDEKLSAKKK